MFTHNNYIILLSFKSTYMFSGGDEYVYTVSEKYRNTVPEDYLT